jgi:hypothetical protein
LQRRGVDRGHAAEKVGAVSLDHLPEARYDAITAPTLRRAQDHMGSSGEGKQPGDQYGVDVEHRQTAEQRLARSDAIAQSVSHAPGIGYLVRMPPNRDLRHAGRTAGAEVRREVLRPNRPFA